MSLSQHHSGKVLVPWFNITEWKLVYDLIYSETAQDWNKALEILKIWKHRTPLLSAGVEGTLIALEALLVDINQLSTYEVSHIFATALVRFLNLCATNNERQGTFYKTAMQNELPKWLISIRHDIAHSHKVPSQSMLELSLKFCLEWLKGKYWDVQYEEMVDFVAYKTENTIIENGIHVYIYLNGIKNYKSKKELKKCIDSFVKSDVSNERIIEIVMEELKREIKQNRENSADKVCVLLIDNLLMFSLKNEDSEAGNKLPTDFLDKWNGLLNIIYELEIMPMFVNGLLKFVCNENQNASCRHVASLWLKEIFQSLIASEENCKDKSTLVFRSKNNCLKNKNFAMEALENVNQFTLNFLKEVLQYNNAPSQFIKDSISLISAFTKDSICQSDQIYGINDLNIAEDDTDDMLVNEIEINATAKSRWILVEDTSAFVNLPLGILPHQNRNKNPLIII